MSESGKIWTESELRRALRAQELDLAPLEIRLVEAEEGRARRADGVLEVAWGGYRGRYVYEYRAQAGPKAIREAAAMAKQSSDATLRPLAIVPYLTTEGLRQLEELGVSGFDLSGNCLLLDPPRLLVRSSGAPSRFKRSALARNVYRGLSALVAQVFLMRPVFASPHDVWSECQRRLNNEALLTRGTVSKALAQLAEDLFVVRTGTSRGEIRVSRPRELLERLQREFKMPMVSRRLSGKFVGTAPPWTRLRGIAVSGRVRIVATGRGSAGFHGSMSRSGKLQVYVSDLTPFLHAQIVAPTVAFPDVELLETAEERVYFDVREEGESAWASPVLTYLELAEGDGRERAAAEELRAAILRALEATR